LLDDPYDPVMATCVAAQPRSLAPLARAVAGVRDAWRQLPEPEGRTVGRRVRIAAAAHRYAPASRPTTPAPSTCWLSS
jgi:hypothetical protein